MTTSVNPAENLAVVRLLEFLSDRSTWYRSLWGIGIILAMDELYEACGVVADGHLSEGAIKRVISSVNKRIGMHPGFTPVEKRLLSQNLQQVPRPGSVAHHMIGQIKSIVSSDYLLRWSRVVASGNFQVELFSRSIAGHLLDAGFSGKYLREFINRNMQGSNPFSLAKLCNDLQQEMTSSPEREMEVLLAFGEIPRLRNGVPASWLQRGGVTGWLSTHGFDPSGVVAPAALVIRVRARDITGAAQLARSESDRYAARTLLATGQPLNRIPKLWVAGSSTAVDLDHDRRGVEVRELFREDRIFSADANKSVDAALELLAHLDGSSQAAAVAGGWGAIEGLLASPSDRSTAADNLASLVTCSFPRAELTRLAHLVKEQYPGNYPDLVAAGSNRERSRLIGQMIIAGNMPTLTGLSDQAGVQRMRKLFANPRAELETVREVISDSFHRLYRQRNLVCTVGGSTAWPSLLGCAQLQN